MSNITVIVNVWKRNSCEEIMQRIESQTVRDQISEIIVWQNESHVDLSATREKYNFTHVHSVNKNWKFHARFTLPLVVNTDYCVVIDDDTLPNEKYLEECIRISKSGDDKVIICANGRDILSKSNPVMQKGYESEDLRATTEVDFGGHSWFFKTEIINMMWRENSRLFDSGEDIELCASASVFGGVKTVALGSEDLRCAADSDRNRFGHLHASSVANVEAHYRARRKMIHHWLGKGWRLKIDE